jgi:hypothetical protein
MKAEDKIGYMKIAANLCGFGFDRKQMDLLVSMYDALIEKKGNLTIMDICKLEQEVKARNDIRTKQEILDQVSEKVNP